MAFGRKGNVFLLSSRMAACCIIRTLHENQRAKGVANLSKPRDRQRERKLSRPLEYADQEYKHSRPLHTVTSLAPSNLRDVNVIL